MGERDEADREGWQQVEGDPSPGSIGAEDQGTDAARPDDEQAREPVNPRVTEAE